MAYLLRIFFDRPWIGLPSCPLYQKGPMHNFFCFSWVYYDNIGKPAFFFFFFKEANHFAPQTFVKLIQQIPQILLKHRLDKYVSSQAWKIVFSQDTTNTVQMGDWTFPRSPAVKSGGLWRVIRRQQEAWAPGPPIRKENLLLANLEPFESMKFSQFSQYFPFPMHKN